jgi:hypothetical protein
LNALLAEASLYGYDTQQQTQEKDLDMAVATQPPRSTSKARSYATLEGERINVYAISERYKIPLSTIKSRQNRDGWPGLNGGKLTLIPKEYAPGLTEGTYLVSKVEKAIQQPTPTDGRFLAGGKWKFSTERVLRELEVSRHILREWDNACPCLNDDPLRFTFENDPDSRKQVKAHDETQILDVKRILAEIKKGRFVDRDGFAWISFSRTFKELNSVSPGVKPECWKIKLLRWKSSCCHLDDEQFQQKTFAFLGKGGPPETWYREDLVGKIKASLQKKKSRPQGTGLKEPPKEKPMVAFARLGLWNENGERWFTVSRAAKEAKEKGVEIHAGRIRRFALIGIPDEWPDEFKKEFPKGKIPSEFKKVPGSKKLRILAIPETALDKLVEIEQAISKQVSPAAKFKTVVQILDDHGIKSLRDRVREFLNILVEIGQLQGQKPARKERGKRGWYAPLLIDIQSLEQLLDGRDLLEVVKEFYTTLKAGSPAEIRSIHVSPALESPSRHAIDESHAERTRGTNNNNTPQVITVPTPSRVVSGPLGIQLFPDEHKATRAGKIADFGTWAVPWKMFELLCRKHPHFYRDIDLGHDACNPNGNNDDPGLPTVWAHVTRIRKLVKRLGIDVKNTRSLGYRLEQKRRKKTIATSCD